MEITLKGRVPSKKNSKQMVCMGGKRLILPSKQYTEWHKKALVQLEEQNVPKEKIDYPVEIEILVYAPDNRKYDLSNKFESIADLLVDYGLIADDNYSILSVIGSVFMGVDKENPRSEIIINKL